MKIDFLDGEKLYHGFSSGKNTVLKNKAYLNKINVFPVADGDTGTNLVLTMHSVVEGCKAEPSFSKVSSRMADAALLGSRGNSGIIFAQFIQGLNDGAKDKNELNQKDFSSAINRGVEFAYKSVTNPVEGTILTVMKSWADAIHKLHEKTHDFVELINHSIETAKASLKETTKKLKVLEEAGVVDAGAQGFVHFIEGFSSFLKTGKKMEEMETIQIDLEESNSHKFDNYKKLQFRFCTEGMVKTDKLSSDQLRKFLSDFGDSLIVAGSKTAAKFHVHTNTPSEIFYRLMDYGTIVQSKVDDMQRQNEIQFNRNSSIALVVDSACDLPAELLDKYQIHLVPINFLYGESNLLDKTTITPHQFYSLLKSHKLSAKTSQPSVKAFENLYSLLFEHYESIISIHLSQNLSGTWNSAKLAAKKFPDKKIAVVDTKNISTSFGLIVQHVAEEIENKKSFDEVVAMAEKISSKAKILVSVKTLKYMVRSGRVSPLKGMFANILNLKPVVSLDENGASILSGKSFGANANTKKITEMVIEKIKSHPLTRYAIGHANNADEAKAIEEKIRAATGESAKFLLDIAPVIGLHAGIGALSISYLEG